MQDEALVHRIHNRRKRFSGVCVCVCVWVCVCVSWFPAPAPVASLTALFFQPRPPPINQGRDGMQARRRAAGTHRQKAQTMWRDREKRKADRGWIPRPTTATTISSSSSSDSSSIQLTSYNTHHLARHESSLPQDGAANHPLVSVPSEKQSGHLTIRH